MIKNINAIFPDEISDETAHYLVNFFMDLALTFESHYFSQIRRYAEAHIPPSLPPDFEKKPA